MSVKVMGGVWDLKIDPSAKLVLLALADHADHDGRNAHPSVRLLSAKTGYSPRAVQYTLRRLEEAGLIEVEGQRSGGRGHATHYHILTQKGATVAPINPVKGANSDTERVQIETLKGAIPLRARVDKTLTVIEPSRESSPYPLRGDAADVSGRATYATTLNSSFDKLVARFKAIDPDFTAGWIKVALVNAESQVGPLPRDRLGKGLDLAMRSIKTAIDGGRIVKPRAFAQKEIVTYLMEQRDDPA